MGSLLAVAPSTALDLKRAQLLVKTLPKEFATSVADATDDIADGVADTVKAAVPRGAYPNVYSRLAGWVTTGKSGKRTSKVRHIVEVRLSPKGPKFSGFSRPNPTYPPAGMAYWYEFGAKGGDDYVAVTLGTGKRKKVLRSKFVDYAKNASRQTAVLDVNDTHTSQLPAYAKAGHWVTPTLDRNAPDIYEAWLDAVAAAFAGWERG